MHALAGLMQLLLLQLPHSCLQGWVRVTIWYFVMAAIIIKLIGRSLLLLFYSLDDMKFPNKAFSSPLPGFLRRLLLQVILEDEKMVVYIHSKDLPLSKESSTHGHLTHPCFGAGHYHRTRVTSIQSTLADVVNSLSSNIFFNLPWLILS